MKITTKINENEMVLKFLGAELSSNRFGAELRKAAYRLGYDLLIIERPNLKDVVQNEQRKKLLSEHRGFGVDEGIFEGLPQDIEWFIAELSPEEVLDVRYINYSYWNELSDGARSPGLAAKNILKDNEVYGESNEGFLNAAQHLKGGGKFAEMILVGQDQNSPLVVLEGHLRLTAYALEPNHIPNPLKVFVGFSEGINNWPLY